MQDYLCPLKTVEFLVPAQGSNVEASDACTYELIDSLRERDLRKEYAGRLAEAVEAVAAAVEAVLAWAQAVRG